METSNSPPAAFERTQMILWLALAVSQILYLIVPQYAKPMVTSRPPEPLFPVVLGVIAIVESIAIALWFRGRAVRPLREGRLDLSSQAGLARLFQAELLAWVLAESIAIYGLVLHILGYGWNAWAPFAVLGMGMLFLCRPWQAALKPPPSAAELGRRGDPIT